ncbi:SAM-dependent methyltransferase [Bremerella cremea]|uniref:SAM-dependent methyltransferase n=1 Tax=Bremerella cremea TaxID=1031537 RepID=A0A368KLB4_9BACT|nr:class I SAM-dependent methyltransferase [Bremerella cremea]RCS41561.1 SAM-dependent methyltransferase [Bremerella cremea]
MTAPPLASFQYSLLDFGAGRKLEQFGPVILDRYSPSAEGFNVAAPKIWPQAVAKYVRKNETEGDWLDADRLPENWQIAAGPLKFRLKTTKFGHLGLFPEQFENWKWLQQTCQTSSQPLKVLNLFAYTGGSSLACALGNAEVAHVDAAANVVKWARNNAELSELSEAPIRWIAEDARKFVKREIKRGNTYDGVILDPPTYGHGSKGEVWRIGKHLPLLLEQLNELMHGSPKLVLLTCHSPGYEDDTLKAMLAEHFPSIRPQQIKAGPLTIADKKGRQLPSGYFARYEEVGKTLGDRS